ncbi:MAG: DUF3810 domain-containing protein [Ruminococcaceae bacterium]|nr:DUF3810 domain-containing protein [Oscillospiraceae bacterium]
MTKTILRLTLSAILLVLLGLLLLLANFLPDVVFAFYPELSRWLLSVIAGVTSVVPFALCEIGIAALIILFIVTLVRAIIKRRMVRWVTGVLLSVSILAFAFVGIWGLNYYAPPMAERLGMEQRQFTTDELKEACKYYRDMANSAAKNVERDADGTMKEYDFSALAEQAGEGFEVLAKDYDCFNGSTVPVKGLISSPLMGKIGMTGGFICLTGEACVSSTTYDAALPFTMCHEIGHRMAFAREDEANFAGFLACSKSERAEFVYSGYYSAFKYCYNALNKVDPSAASQIWSGVNAELAADFGGAYTHYEQIRNETASSVADTVYNSYLNAFSVESGVQSYGEVADLLILWYFEECR